MSIKNTTYKVVEFREKDAIVYNRSNGRSYICPIGSDNGKRYVIIRNQTYYL